MNRSEILAEAERLINNDRAAAYGPVEVNFTRIADLWSVYLDLEVTAVDVAHMMTLLKISRSKENPAGVDNWIDIAGYAALGGELAAIEAESRDLEADMSASHQERVDAWMRRRVDERGRIVSSRHDPDKG